jgi:DNA-binding transcriptional MerR regulator
MSYTVSQFARILGISIRTIHWYDQVGLLKPAYYGTNGYRYYQKDQVEKMQVILLLKKLNFNLKDIKELLAFIISNELNLETQKKQITFFKTIGFNVHEIKKLLYTTDSSRILILTQHKKKLTEELKNKSEMIDQIENTIKELHIIKT